MPKSFNEIVQNIINNIHDSLPDIDTKEGTFIRDVFINPSADEITGIYGDLKLLELAQSVLTATGNDLDNLAGNYFITRKPASKSSGKIRFYLKNSNTLNINENDFPDQILISEGTRIATLPSISQPEILIEVTDSVTKNRSEIKYLDQDPNMNNYRYIEVPAMSVDNGSYTNVDAGKVVQQITNLQDSVLFVNNPYAFIGGTDQENDASLKLRITLAISGSNIGTKDGYLSYVLKQNGVDDAKVIGASDPIMFRDGSYINTQGNYVQGRGGMVDIYIRGQQNEEYTQEFKITPNYLIGTNAYSDIILDRQPINNIVSIKSSNYADLEFINASNYNIEPQIQSSTNTSNILYYKDVKWDFSITDFQDISPYVLPSDLNALQLQQLKRNVDEELTTALSKMSNLDYSINWSLLNKLSSTNMFDYYTYNNNIYKIVATDTRLDGMSFVKKDDQIYIRIYNTPDFILMKDKSAYSNSVSAQDKIRWLNISKLNPNDILLIKCNYDQLINDLQTNIEYKKVLTADVLIKQAEKLPIQVMLDATCYPTYSPSTIKSIIISKIKTYIDSIKKLGGEFDRSDIVTIARNTDGVDAVDINTITIAVLGNTPQKKIVAKDNQYFQVQNIVVNVYTNDRIV